MIYLRIYKFSDRLCINILTMNTVVIVILNNQITLGKHAIAPQPCSNNLMPETIIAQSITKDSQSKARVVKINVILVAVMSLCISQVRSLSSSGLRNGSIKMLPILSTVVMSIQYTHIRMMTLIYNFFLFFEFKLSNQLS